MNNDICKKFNLSASFRIIGIGSNSVPIILDPAIKYPVVKTLMGKDDPVMPKDEDEMVIFVNPDNEDISAITKTFYDADILTLIIASKGYHETPGSYDALSIVDNDFMARTVSGLLYPIFHYGAVSFDFHDLSMQLKNQNRFKVFVDMCLDKEPGMSRILTRMNESLTDTLSLERLSLILAHNACSLLPLTSEELEYFRELTDRINGSVEIEWGLAGDENLKEGQLKIIAIGSGKKLKF